ncbi:hypothetical protein [Streptomyces sp. NBC_00557]|uniref:hypothetical protein n=1 Tax=Streptomyces sp. NBC_00557 TaxID=2975776 RepID=UPI002E81DCE4|nr:hypothetical protein [Streptomyces sp. NBC_00557]WUC36363.1 hypothetical protein OG956_20140 [Streptomyces sp. NBC_00557]
MTETQWNGEPCQARRITAIVADNDSFPLYWARHLVGTRRKAVEVTYGAETFYLDDEDGSGWNKVTHGGSPHWAHSSLTVEPDSVLPRAATLPPNAYRLHLPPAPPTDVCCSVDIDGETVTVRGTGDLPEEARTALAAVVRVAKRRFAEEALTDDKSPLRDHVAEALFTAHNNIGAWRTVDPDIKDRYRQLAEAALAVIRPHGTTLATQLREAESALTRVRALREEARTVSPDSAGPTWDAVEEALTGSAQAGRN